VMVLVVLVVRFWRVWNRIGSVRKASVVMMVVVVVLLMVEGGVIFSFLLALNTNYPTILTSYL